MVSYNKLYTTFTESILFMSVLFLGLEHLRKLQGKIFVLWFKFVFASGFFEQFNIYFLSHEIHNLA